METRQLAKESQQRLNGFMDQIRGSVAVDLSAKNLGEEGTQYVSEALAFNDRRVSLRAACPGIWSFCCSCSALQPATLAITIELKL